jgi:hypothetical protein
MFAKCVAGAGGETRGERRARRRLDHLLSGFFLDEGKVNRTVCGRDHVLERRASGYKRGGGIAAACLEEGRKA